MTATPPEQGTHFWHMAFQRAGTSADWANGTCTPPTGATRYDTFNNIRARLIAAQPTLKNAAVIAFDLQPNQL